MGNTFDKERRRNSSDSSAHASSHACAITHTESTYYLTEAEKRQLRLYFEMIYTERNGIPNREGLKLALHQEENEVILKTILLWLESKHVTDYDHFENVVIGATRVSSSQTILALWEVASFCNFESDDNDKANLFRFCRISLMLISEREDTLNLGEVDRCAELLQNLYIAMARRNDPNMEIGSNMEAFVALVHEFTPHIAKAFHTYLSMRLLLASESPSFKPFLPPSLSHKSETAPQLLLNALALYCEELQSDWKRLYSTTSDGLSFNRISHHVLGYEVKLCLQHIFEF
jgi:hypothetical protein